MTLFQALTSPRSDNYRFRGMNACSLRHHASLMSLQARPQRTASLASVRWLHLSSVTPYQFRGSISVQSMHASGSIHGYHRRGRTEEHCKVCRVIATRIPQSPSTVQKLLREGHDNEVQGDCPWFAREPGASVPPFKDRI